jgi:hypothetical protein
MRLVVHPRDDRSTWTAHRIDGMPSSDGVTLIVIGGHGRQTVPAPRVFLPNAQDLDQLRGAEQCCLM